MTVTEAIKRLQEIHDRYGDLKIVGGYIADDRPLSEIIVIDKAGCEVGSVSKQVPEDSDRRKIEGVFLI